MADSQLNQDRLKRGLEILAERGTATQQELRDQIFSEIPLVDRELELNTASTPRGITNWLWYTTNQARAGWVSKDGRGNWSITEAGRRALQDFPGAVDLEREAARLYQGWDRGQKAALGTRRVSGVAESAVVDAARPLIDKGLGLGESAFVPDRPLWAERSLLEIQRRFDASDVGKVADRIVATFDGASDDEILLAAELLTLHLLPADTKAGLGEQAKRDRVNRVLSLMSEPVTIPTDIDSGFASGAFNPGHMIAGHATRSFQWLIRFALAWVRLDAEARRDTLEDPWRFRDFVFQVWSGWMPSQQRSLLFLAHPEAFAPIVSGKMLERIRAAFAGEIGGTSDDLERDILGINVALQVKRKRAFDFWEEDLRERWAAPSVTDPAPDLDDADTPPDDDPRADGSAVTFPLASDELARALHVPEAWIQQTLELLQRRRQVILYGPPGTGKTYIGKALAKHIAHDASWRLVQFHPSYSYEDFIAGYRPVVDEANGTLVYRLKEGPFLRIAREASRNPDRNYVLVIDEINRGNIAKVFGELYFLLEYRNERIELLYGDEEFMLPPNVYLIGTMNASDRSIALLDAAMRRRFAFLELHPDKAPTNGVLRSWLQEQKLDLTPAAMLDALNSSIHDESLRIGPSFLMPSDGDLSDARLEQIWAHEILPLLEESHFGEVGIEQRFGLPAIRRRLGAATGGAAGLTGVGEPELLDSDG